MRCGTRASSRRRAFTLVELVIAITIMILMLGAAGSILSHLVSMTQLTVEQNVTKRRAQDVFSILTPAFRCAGLGIPSVKFSEYFGGWAQWYNRYISSWQGPIDVIAKDDRPAERKSDGDVLRIAWSVPTGLKYSGGSTGDYGGTPASVTPQDLASFRRLGIIEPIPGTFSRMLDVTKTPFGIRPNTDHDPRSLVTFPGAHTHPMKVTDIGQGDASLSVLGSPPISISDDVMTKVLPRGVIYPFAELCTFRASIAYVADGTFCMLDLEGEEDPFAGGGVPDAEGMSGARIEGVKSVRFFPSPNGREVTAWILVEGDVDDESRTERGASVETVKGRVTRVETSPGTWETERVWEDVDFDDGRYYEDFFMTWRVRNVGLN